MPYQVEQITIAPASREELPTVARLAEAIWPESYRGILDAEQIRYMLKMMYDLPVLEKEYGEGICFDLIFDGGTPIGFASYGPCFEHGCGCAKLHKLYLTPSYHNRGIGSLTLQHVISEARKKGCKALHLNVNRHNAAAIRAYERNGFRKAQELLTDIGGGFVMDDFIMEIRL